jgi:hypothetical protein
MQMSIQSSDSMGFAIGARLFYDCAIAADEKVGMRPGYEICAPMPVMLLVAYSVELSLKAFLSANGVSTEDLAKKYGHDLEQLYRTASPQIRSEVRLGKDSEGVLKLLGNLHKKDYPWRYYSPAEGDFPVFGPLQVLAQDCLRICGAPRSEEIVAR